MCIRSASKFGGPINVTNLLAVLVLTASLSVSALAQDLLLVAV
jgi:hypothetical protein